MKIFQDIKKRAAARPKQAGWQVVDTVQEFWQQVYQHNLNAQVLDVSALVSGFSPKLDSGYFQREQELGDISPCHQTLWIEIADNSMEASLGAALTYLDKDTKTIEQARYYGLADSFAWVCQARPFIKKRYQSTVPLPWQWVEYVDAQGGSTGSLLAPLSIPAYLARLQAAELGSLQSLAPQLAAFIANLGLHTVDLINTRKAQVTAQAAGSLHYQQVTLSLLQPT